MTIPVEMTNEVMQVFVFTTIFVSKRFLFCVFIVAKKKFFFFPFCYFFSDLLSSNYVEIHYEGGKPVLSKVKFPFVHVQNNASERLKMFRIVGRREDPYRSR